MFASQAAVTAFKEDYFTTDPLAMIDEDFSGWNARRLRYAVNWAYYESNVYRMIHRWAKRYKVEYGLYEYTRSIYNPTARIGDFYSIHLWGGRLDKNAGADIKTAIPIGTENDDIRPHIADVWRWSNWAINKDIIPLRGCIFGDYAIMAVEDTKKERVYLKNINPGVIQDVTFDDYGNVKSYVIVENRKDPVNKDKIVVYTETADRDGETVEYTTLKDNVPYAWNGEAATWSGPYGFIPLVIGQHKNIGLDWGLSEIHNVMGEIREVDDLASKLSDQIRKMVHSKWLFAGVTKPTTTPTATHTTAIPGTTAYAQRPQPGREEIDAFYGPVGAEATALVTPLDIEAASNYINNILADIEEKLPELRVSRKDEKTGGEKSGRAIREARRESTGKVEQRRVSYDDALVRVQKMALTMGGIRGYFDGINENSYEAGDLDHEILARPIFDDDPLDELEVQAQEFAIGEYPVLTKWRKLLRSQGVTDEKELQDRLDEMLADAAANDGFGFASKNDVVEQ